jgi:hypothetical protein
MEPSAERGVNRVDLIAGGAMLAVCAAFVVVAWGYGIGTPARMGRGFFPFSFGIVGMLLALLIMARSLVVPGGLHEALHKRSVIFVTAGVVAFGLLIETAGLGPAVFATTVLSSFADPEARLKGAVLLGLGLTAGIWVVFVHLLGLQIPLVQGWR